MQPQLAAARATAQTNFDSSHIVLQTLGEAAEGSPRAKTVAARFDLKSPLRGTRLQLTLYKEGLLTVRSDHYGTRSSERTLDLRYLDPRPNISRVAGMRTLHLFALSVALAGVFAALAAVLSFSWCMPPAVALGVAAGALGWSFIRHCGERCVFRTRNGHAAALVLFGTVGSIRTLRGIVPAIVAAIRDAGVGEPDKNVYLRGEMHEHYRLARAGAISEEECNTCTQRILRQFA